MSCPPFVELEIGQLDDGDPMIGRVVAEPGCFGAELSLTAERIVRAVDKAHAENRLVPRGEAFDVGCRQTDVVQGGMDDCFVVQHCRSSYPL